MYLLLMGLSAIVWFAYLLIVIPLVSFVPALAARTNFQTAPRGAFAVYIPFFVLLAAFVGFTLAMIIRNGIEVRSGYTTLPSGARRYNLVDRHTGEIIRPAGVKPLSFSISLNLKAERARAARAAASGDWESAEV